MGLQVEAWCEICIGFLLTLRGSGLEYVASQNPVTTSSPHPTHLVWKLGRGHEYLLL